jgi:hypothetical protein
MDSFTHCWKNARLSVALVVAAFLFHAGSTLAQPALAPAEIVHLRLERSDEGIFLNAQLKFELSPVVQDALRKGIPVYFLAEAHLMRDRWYWSDKKLASATRQSRLTYHPLTRRWRLSVTQGASAGVNPGVALNQNFEELPEAIAALSQLSRWKIAEPSEIDPEARYNVDFSFRLDQSELPRPFQIGLLGQTDWTISVARNQRVSMELTK